MTEIPLVAPERDKNGKIIKDRICVVVDDQDADLEEWNWSIHQGRYAVRNHRIDKGEYTFVYLHKEVLRRKLKRDLSNNEHVVFVDGNPLNCRRKNLELKTKKVKIRKQLKNAKTWTVKHNSEFTISVNLYVFNDDEDKFEEMKQLIEDFLYNSLRAGGVK